jgi:hypothetical protein
MDGKPSTGVHEGVQGGGGSTGDSRGSGAPTSRGPRHPARRLPRLAAAAGGPASGRGPRSRPPMSKRHQVRDIRAVDVRGSRGRTVQLGNLVPGTTHDPCQDPIQQVRGGSHRSTPIRTGWRFPPHALQNSDICAIRLIVILSDAVKLSTMACGKAVMRILQGVDGARHLISRPRALPPRSG